MYIYDFLFSSSSSFIAEQSPNHTIDRKDAPRSVSSDNLDKYNPSPLPRRNDSPLAKRIASLECECE